MPISKTGADATSRGRRSPRKARRSTISAGPERSASNEDSLRSGVRIGNASKQSMKDRSSYNRFSALSSSEEAPGTWSEKRALAPREKAWSERVLLSSPAADTDISHTQIEPVLRPEIGALPAPRILSPVPRLESTDPKADDKPSVDLVPSPVPMQTQFRFTCPVPAPSSRIPGPPASNLASSSGAQVHENPNGGLFQKNHELFDTFTYPIFGIPTGGPCDSSTQSRPNPKYADVSIDTQPSSVELSTNHIPLAVPPLPTSVYRGWPSPTNSPPAPTTTDRKSRFFPTSLTLPPPPPPPARKPNNLPPLSFTSSNSNSTPSDSLPSLPTIIKPLKKHPPPPIAISHAPLHSPIIIRPPFNPTVLPLGILSSSNARSSQKGAATHHPRQPWSHRPSLQGGNMDFLKVSTPGFYAGGEEDPLVRVVEDEDEVVIEDLGRWEVNIEGEMEGWEGVDRGFWVEV